MLGVWETDLVDDKDTSEDQVRVFVVMHGATDEIDSCVEGEGVDNDDSYREIGVLDRVGVSRGVTDDIIPSFRSRRLSTGVHN